MAKTSKKPTSRRSNVKPAPLPKGPKNPKPGRRKPPDATKIPGFKFGGGTI